MVLKLKLIRLKGIDIPIVALTAFNKAEINGNRALSAGIKFYYYKTI
jgi:hypothetical protein